VVQHCPTYCSNESTKEIKYGSDYSEGALVNWTAMLEHRTNRGKTDKERTWVNIVELYITLKHSENKTVDMKGRIS